MKKFTRRHYNKKLIALGLSAFMGIGLTSTGFAAWVMSRDAEDSASGGVNVSTITDSSLEIILDSDSYTQDGDKKILKDNFSFDAAENDVSGRLRWDGEKFEDLSVTIKGELKADANVDYELTATLELPAGILAALNAGYLAWPATDSSENKWYTIEYENEGVIEHRAVPVPVTVVEGADGRKTFEFKIEFVWGEKFAGMNPSLYYDVDETGKAVDNVEMAQEMGAFWNMLTGKNSENIDFTTAYEGEFTIRLYAKALDGTVSE